MKDIFGYLETETKKYPICFNVNVMEELQDEYGSLIKWTELIEPKDAKIEPSIKALKNGVLLMINEGIDIEKENKNIDQPYVNLKQVGRIITEIGLVNASKQIKDLTTKSLEIDDDIKNA